MYALHISYPFICRGTSGLILFPNNWVYSSAEMDVQETLYLYGSFLLLYYFYEPSEVHKKRPL